MGLLDGPLQEGEYRVLVSSVVNINGLRWWGGRGDARVRAPTSDSGAADAPAPPTPRPSGCRLRRIRRGLSVDRPTQPHPSVDALLGSEAFSALIRRHGRPRVVEAARGAVALVRSDIAAGRMPDDPADTETYAALSGAWLLASDMPSLRRIINATGVVLHTNLGRAPLADSAVGAMTRAAQEYSNLEYDLDAGERGSRYAHCVSPADRADRRGGRARREQRGGRAGAGAHDARAGRGRGRFAG